MSAGPGAPLGSTDYKVMTPEQARLGHHVEENLNMNIKNVKIDQKIMKFVPKSLNVS